MSDKINDRSVIQWFPGHMTKAERMMTESIKSVDLVCEVRDARIPFSSSNPDVEKICGGKPRIIILNREDLADPLSTKNWLRYLGQQGVECFSTDARGKSASSSLSASIRKVLSDKMQKNAEKGMAGKSVRVMVAGIPNVGKSTLINSLAGRKAALAADKPGVTRGKQWVSAGNGIELLDTPGILWPKFDCREVGECLAITGAVKSDVIDSVELASFFLKYLSVNYSEAVKSRYKLETDGSEPGYELLEKAALKRGMLISGGEADTERMALVLLKEYREGRLGRITLEQPGVQYA